MYQTEINEMMNKLVYATALSSSKTQVDTCEGGFQKLPFHIPQTYRRQRVRPCVKTPTGTCRVSGGPRH